MRAWPRSQVRRRGSRNPVFRSSCSRNPTGAGGDQSSAWPRSAARRVASRRSRLADRSDASLLAPGRSSGQERQPRLADDRTAERTAGRPRLIPERTDVGPLARAFSGAGAGTARRNVPKLGWTAPITSKPRGRSQRCLRTMVQSISSWASWPTRMRTRSSTRLRRMLCR